MGRRNRTTSSKSHTLPSSPTHSFTSSSSSDFEFTISLSPHKSSAAADDLFYKGQLLPLHLSPRLSMVRNLLLSSSSSSSSTTTSRDSTASTSSSDGLLLDCDSSRPSSAAADDELFIKRPPSTAAAPTDNIHSRKSSKYFSLAKLSSVFRKENKAAAPSGGAVKRVSSTAREVLRKYLNKVKPLYEKLSQKQQQQQKMTSHAAAPPPPPSSSRIPRSNENPSRQISLSFSGNLSYPKRRSHISSCPSSMMSSPRRGESGFGPTQMDRVGSGLYSSGASSMEDLQSAIQGAIAHCKNSMMKNNNSITVSNEI